LFQWHRENLAIDQQIGFLKASNSSKSETMRRTLRFFRKRVPEGAISHRYFLLPLFRFMRPTALQILEDGGDCAYRARAFIVLLRRLDIEATKMVLHDREDRASHAVVKVETERGPYVVDVLYGVIHQWEDGSPIPVERLRNPSVLADSVERNRLDSVEGDYPVSQYSFDDVKTINWQKSSLDRVAYRILVFVVGREVTDNLPRTRLSEEPALMVVAFCLFLQFVFALVLLRLRKHLRSPGGARRARNDDH
jgi:hypothetical protein